MSENLHGIDDLFRKAIEKVDESPGEDVWRNIDKQLDKRKVAFLLKKSTKWRWVAAACLIFSFGMAMFVIQSKIISLPVAKKTESPSSIIIKRNPTKTKDVNTKVPGTTVEENADKNKSTATTFLQNDLINGDKADSTSVKSSNLAAITRDNEVNKRAGNIAPSTTQKLKKSPVNKVPRKENLAINQQNIYTSTERKSLTVIKQDDRKFAAHKMVKTKESTFITKQSTNTNSTNQIKEWDQPAYTINASLSMGEQANLALHNAGNISFPARPSQNLPVNDMAIKNPSRKFSPALIASVFYSPDFSSNRTRSDKPRFREDERNEIKRNEENTSSSTTGILLQYGLTKQWSVESGITLSNINTGFKPRTIFARPDNNGKITFRFTCAAGTSNVSLKSAAQPLPGDSIRVLNGNNQLQYIGVPFNLRYHFNLGKLSVQLGIGLSAFFLAKSNIETTVATTSGNEKASASDIQGLKKNYINSLLSVRASYALSKNISFDFMPQARIGLSPINKQSPVKTNYNSLGLGLGLSFKLL